MTKQEFVARVAQRSGLTTRDAGKAIDATFATVTDVLNAGDTIAFPGFGKFSTTQSTATTGLRPRTARVELAGRVPTFSAGSQLKAAVKGR